MTRENGEKPDKPPSRGRGWRETDTSPFRFNRNFDRLGVGRIVNSSRTKDPNEFRRRNDLLTKLAEAGQSEVLRAFKNGEIHIEELVDADREGRLRGAELLPYLSLKRPLWDAIDAALPLMGRSESTRKRYRTVPDEVSQGEVCGIPPGIGPRCRPGAG